METNSFKEYSGLTIMSKEEQQPMKACLMFFAGGMQALQGINLRANVLSECYTKGAINRGYQLFNFIKRIFRSAIVFLDVIVSQVESQHELKSI